MPPKDYLARSAANLGYMNFQHPSRGRIKRLRLFPSPGQNCVSMELALLQQVLLHELDGCVKLVV
jgi:hypothetical protein